MFVPCLFIATKPRPPKYVFQEALTKLTKNEKPDMQETLVEKKRDLLHFSSFFSHYSLCGDGWQLYDVSICRNRFLGFA